MLHYKDAPNLNERATDCYTNHGVRRDATDSGTI